jgi:hypothetical protein
MPNLRENRFIVAREPVVVGIARLREPGKPHSSSGSSAVHLSSRFALRKSPSVLEKVPKETVIAEAKKIVDTRA